MNSLKLELAFMIILVISLITSFFTKIYSYSQMIMGVLLIIMGYNNQKHFKRKNMTYIYYIFGELVIIFTIIKWIKLYI
ncbi:MAG: hypothetical protein IKF01_01150 [Bacilli bacterium]|nr:hypothetical protein [Bacilli bacterium]